MSQKMKSTKLILIGLALALLTAGFVSAQDGDAEKLRNGVAVNSEIGGESHGRFFIRARKGQTITVLVTPVGKRRNLVTKDGNFNLSVTRGSIDGQEVNGRQTGGRKQILWTGKARSTENYYFDTTAFPTTRYRIRVTVK
ncbi:MAG TPA: hypothetical protein VGC97_05615 [Pyrinomonadaceae bacterium]|jgi:hypothetical protein